MSGRRYLVIVRAGDHSAHEEWTSPAAARNFDLFVSYSGDEPGRFASGCEKYERRKGEKFGALGAWIKELGSRLDAYEAVWLPDDDIRTDAAGISRMFKLFSEHKLELAQPAFKQYARHPIAAQHIDYVLRYTSFVSSDATVFSREALRACLRTFELGASGSALAFVWPRMLGDGAKRVAILDAAPVRRSPRAADREDGYMDGFPESGDDSLLNEYGIAIPRPEEVVFDGGVPLWSPWQEQPEQPGVPRQNPRSGRKRRRAGRKRKRGSKRRRLNGKKRVRAGSGKSAKRIRRAIKRARVKRRNVRIKRLPQEERRTSSASGSRPARPLVIAKG